MLYTCFVTVLFTTILLPAVYIRYIPFHTILTKRQKQTLLAGYALIWAAETLAIAIVMIRGILPFDWPAFKGILFVSWIPYMLINLCCIRPYMAQHLFVLGIQAMYTVAMHTVAINLTLTLFQPVRFFDYAAAYYALYILLFCLFLPILRRFFCELFIQYDALHRSYLWSPFCLVPLMLAYDQAITMTPYTLSEAYLIPRLCSSIAGIIIAAVIRAVIIRFSQHIESERKTYALHKELQSLSQYASQLETSQQRLAILRHDARHQLRILSCLLQENRTDEALTVIQTLRRRTTAGGS